MNARQIVREIIGKPFQRNGRGPDSFDCFGLWWWIQTEFAKRDIPSYLAVDEDSLMGHAVRELKMVVAGRNWRRLDEPETGCLVAISKRRICDHVGVFLRDGRRSMVYHANEGTTVHGFMLHRAASQGFTVKGFYDYDGNVC